MRNSVRSEVEKRMMSRFSRQTENTATMLRIFIPGPPRHLLGHQRRGDQDESREEKRGARQIPSGGDRMGEGREKRREA